MDVKCKSSMVFGSPGLGKTTAAVCKFMNAIEPEKKRLQCIFFCMNFECAYQAYRLSQQITNTVNAKLVNKDSFREGGAQDTQVIFGSSHDIVDYTVRYNIDWSSIKLVCFDDADRSMSFVKVENSVLKKLNPEAKIMIITSTIRMDPKSQSLKEKLSQIRGESVEENYVTYERTQTKTEHYAVEHSSSRPKLQILNDICGLLIDTQNQKSKIIVFCKDQSQAQDLNLKMMNKYGLRVLMFCGDASYAFRAEIVDKMMTDNVQIILTTEHLATGMNIPNAAICIMYDVPCCYPNNLQPNKKVYTFMANRVGRFGQQSIVISLMRKIDVGMFTKALPFCMVSHDLKNQ